MDCPAKLRFLRELITLKSGVLQTVLFSQGCVCEICWAICLCFLFTTAVTDITIIMVALAELHSHSLVHHDCKGIIWITTHTSECTRVFFSEVLPALQCWLQQILALQAAEMTSSLSNEFCNGQLISFPSVHSAGWKNQITCQNFTKDFPTILMLR